MRIKICIEGDLSRALVWEAERRGIQVEELVWNIVRRSSSRLLVTWRTAHRGVHILGERPGPGEVRSLESVLAKSYGPSKPALEGVASAESG